MSSFALDQIDGELRAAVRTFAERHSIPGASVGIVVDQNLAWTHGHGFADVERGRPIDANTLFQIASISKSFTATALIQLRDEGALDLDDPLVQHVPEFAAASNPFGPLEHVTLWRLLLHSSGLQNELPAIDPTRHDQLFQAELLAHLDKVRVTVAPGTVFQYSNLGYRLLAEVVARVSGEPFVDHERAAVLEPLAMTSTTVVPADTLVEHVAQGYGPYGFQDRRQPVDATDTMLCEGDGHLWSSVEDLGRWVSLQFRTDPGLARNGAQILAGGSLAQMHAAGFPADEAWTEMRGMGWGIAKVDGRRLIGHGGLMDGFNSHVCFSATDRVGVIVLLNAMPLRGSATELARGLFASVIASSVPRDPAGPAVSQPPELVPAPWADLLGRYWDEDDDEVYRVEFRDGSLVTCSEPGGERTVIVVTDDREVFFMPSMGRDVTFQRDGSGAVTGMKIGGYPMIRLAPVGSR